MEPEACGFGTKRTMQGVVNAVERNMEGKESLDFLGKLVMQHSEGRRRSLRRSCAARSNGEDSEESIVRLGTRRREKHILWRLVCRQQWASERISSPCNTWKHACSLSASRECK